jgi:sirohydrochlorin cobaltochelatase
MKALILFAHGSRDPAWAKPIHAVRDLIQCQNPSSHVCAAFLEFMTPNLAGTLQDLSEQGIRQVVILPMFIAAGGHLLNDLPRLVDEICSKLPDMRVTIASPVGALPSVQDAMAACATQLLNRPN